MFKIGDVKMEIGVSDKSRNMGVVTYDNVERRLQINLLPISS